MLSFSLICLNFLIVGVFSFKGKDFECDTSVRLENGHYTIARKVGFLKASCRRGYSLAGNKFVYCDNRSWTVQLPKCVRATCPKRFTVPEHALTYETHQGAVVSVYCHSNYTLVGANTIYCNGSVWKPTLPACIRTNDRKPQRRCSFDMDMCGFTHDPNHDFDWSRENSLTPRYHVGTGPKYDHSLGVVGAVNGSGYYMFIESSSQQYLDTARLYSPVYEPHSANSMCLRFFYHMFGSGMGVLRVYVNRIGRTSLDESRTVFERSGNQGDQWLEAVVRLDPVSVEFQVVFEGIRGSSVVSNIAIDDFELIDNCPKSTTPEPSSAQRPITQPPLQPPIVESCQQICGFMGVSCSCRTDCAQNSSCCIDYALYCFLDITTENTQTSPINRIAINDAHTSSDEEESSGFTDSILFALLPIVGILSLIVLIGIVVISRLRNCDFYAKDTDLTSSVHFLSNDEEINFNSPYDKVA